MLAAFDWLSHTDTVLDEDDMGNIHHNGALSRKQADFDVSYHHYSKAIEYRLEDWSR